MNVNIYLAPSLSLAPFYWENIILLRLKGLGPAERSVQGNRCCLLKNYRIPAETFKMIIKFGNISQIKMKSTKIFIFGLRSFIQKPLCNNFILAMAVSPNDQGHVILR